MKYFAYSSSGEFNGWYDDQIHTNIPTPNIQVSDSDYHSFYDLMCNGKQVSVVDGKLVSSDIVPPAPTWDEIRNQRNLLLAESDYTQIPDNELTTEKQQEWKTYRQTLRRIPETYSSPELVVWPTKPA